MLLKRFCKGSGRSVTKEMVPRNCTTLSPGVKLDPVYYIIHDNQRVSDLVSIVKTFI